MLDALAPFARHDARGRARCRPEAESAFRSPFQRDRDRIVHAVAFRRLEYKTQVFVNHEGDHFRTRLTHSLEVAQIARTIARALRADEDLAETVALAHDLGHPPFGHAGEEALDAAMAPYGGFDHNVQTFRVLTEIERRYAAFDGLNLTLETLEGVIKHNGPVTEPVHPAFRRFAELHGVILDGFAGAEAQAAAISDDLAYNNHDLDDGLRAGLFDLADLDGLPLVGPSFAEVRRLHPGIDRRRLIHEGIRRMVHAMVADVIDESSRRIAAHRPLSVEDVKRLPEPVIAFSAPMAAVNATLRAFLRERMYRHYKVRRMQHKAGEVARRLFAFLDDHPDCLPEGWRERAEAGDEPARARVVADYIAGMTDRFALAEHRRLFDPDRLTR